MEEIYQLLNELKTKINNKFHARHADHINIFLERATHKINEYATVEEEEQEPPTKKSRRTENEVEAEDIKSPQVFLSNKIKALDGKNVTTDQLLDVVKDMACMLTASYSEVYRTDGTLLQTLIADDGCKFCFVYLNDSIIYNNGLLINIFHFNRGITAIYNSSLFNALDIKLYNQYLFIYSMFHAGKYQELVVINLFTMEIEFKKIFEDNESSFDYISISYLSDQYYISIFQYNHGVSVYHWQQDQHQLIFLHFVKPQEYSIFLRLSDEHYNTFEPVDDDYYKRTTITDIYYCPSQSGCLYLTTRKHVYKYHLFHHELAVIKSLFFCLCCQNIECGQDFLRSLQAVLLEI